MARSLTRCVAKRLHFVERGVRARLKVHRLCNLFLSQPIPTDVSSHSMADSRDKLHLTRHLPIHAQNFTVRAHSAAQVPRSHFASTCSDVSSRPSCFEIFVMEGHIFTIPQFESHFCARRIDATRESLFKNWPDVTTRPSLFFVAKNDVTTRSPVHCGDVRR